MVGNKSSAVTAGGLSRCHAGQVITRATRQWSSLSAVTAEETHPYRLESAVVRSPDLSGSPVTSGELLRDSRRRLRRLRYQPQLCRPQRAPAKMLRERMNRPHLCARDRAPMQRGWWWMALSAQVEEGPVPVPARPALPFCTQKAGPNARLHALLGSLFIIPLFIVIFGLYFFFLK